MGELRASFELAYPAAAGIDVGPTRHLVAVPVDRAEQPVREFPSFTEDLRRLAHWLTACGDDSLRSAIGTASAPKSPPRRIALRCWVYAVANPRKLRRSASQRVSYHLGVCRTLGAYSCVGCARADEGKVR